MNYKLQIISNGNKYFNLDYDNTILSTINSFSDLEAFDYTLIDLNYNKLWNFNKDQNKFEEDINIKTLTDSIKDYDKIIIIIPSNEEYAISEFLSPEKKQIKNDTTIITRFLNDYFGITQISLDYGKNETEIEDEKIESDFYFKDTSNFNILTKTNTNKPTTIQRRNIVLTTLQLSYGEDIQNFINQIFYQSTEDIPDWFDEIEMFDDEKQKNTITKSKKEIKKFNEIINNAEEKLKENNYYKSILYTQDKPLEKTVRNILQEILQYNLSDFKDEKRADFLIVLDDITFIGEIKGVNSNLKNSHLAQLNVHYENRKDLLKEKNIDENLKPIIVINRFKKYPPEKRKPIDEEQINLAINKYNNTLIITVECLLVLYEQYKNQEITTEEIKNKFKDEKGLFKP